MSIHYPDYSFYTAPGFTDEIIHLYYTDQLTAGAEQA